MGRGGSASPRLAGAHPSPSPSPSQVVPYLFEFKCTVKPRFQGARLVAFMAAEFPSVPRSYYEKAAADGRLRIEPQGREGPAAKKRRAMAAAAATAPGDAVLAASDCVRHLLHRHEPPALAVAPTVLGRSPAGIWGVGKPPGMPVHAAGGYRKNTVCGALEAAARAAGVGPPRDGDEPGPRPPPPPGVVPWPAYLHPLHRLDKPVSGVLLFAESADAAVAACAEISSRAVDKTYIARVAGAWPPGPPVRIDVALAWDGGAHAAVAHADGPKWGAEGDAPPPALARGRGAPRPCVTLVSLLAHAPDGATSVVECRPLTGRPHQIRAHLGHAGHPIANDALYGGPWPGPTRPRLAAHGGAEGAGEGGAGAAGGDRGGPGAVAALAREAGWAGEEEGGSDASTPAPAPPLPPHPAVAACPFCPASARPWALDELRPLWLHARAYAGPGWAFECPPPAWAGAGWRAPALGGASGGAV